MSATKFRARVLFVCGSRNQTTQMHQIAKAMPDVEAVFTPSFADGDLLMWFCRVTGVTERTILGKKSIERCFDYLAKHGLNVDYRGLRGGYHLVVACTDLIVPRRLRGYPIVVVQEGAFDRPNTCTWWCERVRWLPLWLGGTGMTGLSGLYDRFCAASDGYRDDLIARGAAPETVVATGIPNFDNCAAYHENSFPHRDYVLVCTSDCRETFKTDDRPAFIRRCVEIAAGRQLIFKLHPLEQVERASSEIHSYAPDALIYTDGSAEEMIANCAVLVTQWSSVAFVGIALGKEVHSYFDLKELHRLLPLQNRIAARNIAEVCRQVLCKHHDWVPTSDHSTIADGSLSWSDAVS